MEAFPALETLSDDELDETIRALEEEDDRISLRRRLLHARIDRLRREHEARLRNHLDEVAAEGHTPDSVVRPIFEGTGELPPDHGLEPMPELSSLSDEELRQLIHELEMEEDDVSLYRRVVQGRHDMLLAARELRAKHGALDLAAIARVLASGTPRSQTDT